MALGGIKPVDVTCKEDIKILLVAHGVICGNKMLDLQEAKVIIPKNTKLTVVDFNKVNANIVTVSCEVGGHDVIFELPREYLAGDLKRFDKAFKEFQVKFAKKCAEMDRKVRERKREKNRKVI